MTATLTSITTHANIGQGVGACTTLENKFRFRAGVAEPTDKPVRRAYWDVRQDDPAKAQELIGGKGFTVKKVDGQGWMVAKGGEKVETDSPADHYNTVLKMAKKRALVDAVLTTTAASDIFTQDLEDISASLALLTPPDPATTTAPPPSVQAAVIEVPAIPASPLVPAEPQGSGYPETEGLDFRHVTVHFGKNRGQTLADLTPQQLHWYETEWMPKKVTQGNADAGDRALIGGLQAYREWREAEKKAETGAIALQPKRRRAATRATESAQAA